MNSLPARRLLIVGGLIILQACGVGTAPADSGTIDAGHRDAGVAIDAGRPSAIDAGLMTYDSGQPDSGLATDAGPITDSGVFVADAGTVIVDSGAMAVDAGGEVGALCSTDNDCGAVRVDDGGQPWCKHTTSLSGAAYRDGYCTRRCTIGNDCGAGNACVYWLGPVGEADNLCFKGCDDAGDCRTGYACRDIGFTPGEYPNVCLFLEADGGEPEVFDAGHGAASAAGTNCTTANQETRCGSTQWFSCLPALTDGGTPSVYPNGMCTGDCSATLDDDWCGTSGSGVCNPLVIGNDAHGVRVGWLCERDCSSDDSACRTGYVCQDSSVCRPDCRTDAGRVCDDGLQCSEATGQCF